MKQSNQKLKLLYLLKILSEKTDEEHKMTVPQMIQELEKYGISAERKSIYDDIEALRFFGLDITNYIADGKNTFALEYKKSNNYTPDYNSLTPSHFYSYNVTSFEPVYLCGDFDEKDSALTKLDSYESDVTKSGMGYYYGALSYAVKLPESDLGGKVISVCGDFDICRIRIGKRTFTFFSEEPMIELFNLDCGMVAEVTIYNTPYNLLRGANEFARPFGIEKIKLCSFDY